MIPECLYVCLFVCLFGIGRVWLVAGTRQKKSSVYNSFTIQRPTWTQAVLDCSAGSESLHLRVYTSSIWVTIKDWPRPLQHR